MTRFANMIRAFARDEEGIALTEYLILLGLLVGGVILSVITIGNYLGYAWSAWATWFSSNVLLNGIPT